MRRAQGHMNSELVLIPGEIGPGLVPRGFSEHMLERALRISDPEPLWEDSLTLAALAQRWNGHGQEKREIKAAQMFCEIQLGHILGPRPGPPAQDEHGRFLPVPYSRANMEEGLIPPPRISELQRYSRWRDPLLEEVRNGKLSRRSLLLLVDQWESKERPEPTAEDLDIRAGDFRDALSGISPSSVALILTDPPYPREYLPLWDALGEWASTALVDGGSLVAYCGQSILPEALRRLDVNLRYWWTIALVHGQSQMIPGKWVSAGWKPLLWFVRDHRLSQTMLADTVHGGAARKTIPTGDDGSWGQSVEPLEPIISALTGPDDLIVDPFAGSGTVGLAARRFGRRFIGAEIGSTG